MRFLQRGKTGTLGDMTTGLAMVLTALITLLVYGGASLLVVRALIRARVDGVTRGVGGTILLLLLWALCTATAVVIVEFLQLPLGHAGEFFLVPNVGLSLLVLVVAIVVLLRRSA